MNKNTNYNTLQLGIYSRQQQKIVHSNLADIMLQLNLDYRDYKFTVYRAAAKFIALQKSLYTFYIPYDLIMAVLTRHGMRDDDINLMVPPFQLTSLVQDIFSAAEQLGHFVKVHSFNVETATAVLTSLFWNVFDPRRYHSVSVLEIKLSLLLLCKLQNSKHLAGEIFSLIHNSKTHCVSQYNFEYLCSSLAKLYTYIDEESSYGLHNVKPMLEQSLAKYPNKLGFTEQQFYQLWTKADTRLLIYSHLLALVKRIENAELLVHNNICAACRITPIIGIRFKCQICRNLSLCLKCFACGFNSSRHQLNHRMFEAYTEDLPPKKLSHYFAKICHMFLMHGSNGAEGEESNELCYLNELNTANETDLMTIPTSPRSMFSNINNNSTATSTMSTIAEVAATVNNLTNTCLQVKRDNAFDVQHTIDALESQVSLAGLSLTASNALNVSERLQSLIDRLLQQNVKLESLLRCIQSASHEQISCFLKAHQQFLLEIIDEMRNFSTTNNLRCTYLAASTPTINRSLRHNDKEPVVQQTAEICNFSDVGSHLTHSINGADINRSYLEANKSDFSIRDLSTWFNARRSSLPNYDNKNNGQEVPTHPLSSLAGNLANDIKLRETDMLNFRLLLLKVKEIVEDSYSDNTELSAATQHLENVLENIIHTEENDIHMSSSTK